MENPILREALRHRGAGWSILPLKMGEKKPALRWKRYQVAPASTRSIRRWFKSQEYGIAVVYGAVSGHLAAMDFDELEAFHAWATEYPELAETLPMVETRRGRHVYFRTDPADVRALREALGKPPDATGAIHLPAGELRVGSGCYCVLPPSVHPSGFQYRWLREPTLPLPVVNPSVFVPATCYREDGDAREAQREPKTLSGEVGAGCCAGGGVESLVQQAIERTLPTMSGQRHRAVFQLAREFKAIPALADASFAELKPYVRDWHSRALSFISTKPFDQTWLDFGEGWGKVRFPAGEDPISMIVTKALASELPGIALEYDLPAMQALIAICRELQRAAGDSAFYLSARTAGRLLSVSHTQASLYLRGLCRDEVLREVSKGSQSSGKASRYRYQCDL